MAFWAINAFGKVKDFSSEATKKIRAYVNVPNETSEFKAKAQLQTPSQPENKVLSEGQLMELQLKEYKKLVLLQQKIVRTHQENQRQKCETRQRELQDLNRLLMQNEEKERKDRQKDALISVLQSGKKSIQDIIEENIQIKEKLILSENK